MATETIPADPVVVLTNVSWKTYENLLADLADRSAPRLTFDRGVLEIMSPTPELEELNRTLNLIVEIVAAELSIDIRNLGSSTFKDAELQRGFEPGSCFYVANAARIGGKKRLDLASDPPPDLEIEIDLSSTSVAKMPIYARVGVPEVWRFDGRSMHVWILHGQEYVPSNRSSVFPLLGPSVLEDFLEKSRDWERPRLLNAIRDWAREERAR